jgi:hypothetical protein
LRAEYDPQAVQIEIASVLAASGHRSEATQLLLAAADEPAWEPNIVAALAALDPVHSDDLAGMLIAKATSLLGNGDAPDSEER